MYSLIHTVKKISPQFYHKGSKINDAKEAPVFISSHRHFFKKTFFFIIETSQRMQPPETADASPNCSFMSYATICHAKRGAKQFVFCGSIFPYSKPETPQCLGPSVVVDTILYYINSIISNAMVMCDDIV